MTMLGSMLTSGALDLAEVWTLSSPDFVVNVRGCADRTAQREDQWMSGQPRKYVDTPATIHEVVLEFSDHARAVVRQEDAESGQEEHWERQVAITQARAALALESWMGSMVQEVAAMVVAGLEEPLLRQLSGMHDKLHGPR